MSNNIVFSGEIRAALGRIERLLNDPETRAFWDLGPVEDEITLRIGADIECLIGNYMKQNGFSHWWNLSQTYKLDNHPECRDLYKRLRGAVSRHNLGEAEFDNKLFELNPKPSAPEEIIRCYALMEKRLETLCQQAGFDFRMGDGHWHISFSRSSGEIIPFNNPFLRQLSITQILDQTLLPALFIKPRQAEFNASPNAPDYIAARGSKFDASIFESSFRPYEDGTMRREVRIAHMAPYLPVLMIVSAIERTLISRPETGVHPAPAHLDISGPGQGYWVEPKDHDRRRVHKGKGGYLDYLHDSFAGDKLERLFPRIAPTLKTALVESYIDYFDDPMKHYIVPYNQGERYALRQKAVLLLESLQPAPRPQAPLYAL